MKRSKIMPYTHKFKATNAVIFILFMTFIILMAYFKFLDVQTSLAIGNFAEKQLERQDKRIEELIRENEELKGKLNTKEQVDTKIKNSPNVKAYTLSKAREVFGDEHIDEFEKLIEKESGFNLFALNKSSGACGIFQSLPCNKLPGFDLESQVTWGINYIKNRYISPSAALAFHSRHGWY